MRRIIIVLFVWNYIPVLSTAQETAFVLNSSGTTISGGTYAIAFSLGEVAIGQFFNANYSLQEGYLSDSSIEKPLGLGDESQLLKLTVFPNPASDRVTLGGIEEKILTVRIFDHAGRLIATKKVVDNSFSVQDMNSGVFSLLFYSDKIDEELIGHYSLIIKK